MTINPNPNDPGSRVLFAFVLAPAAAPLVFTLAMVMGDVFGGHGTDVAAYGTVLALGGLLAYATPVVVGIPGYFLLRARGLWNRGELLSGGAVAGALLPGVFLSRNDLSS